MNNVQQRKKTVSNILFSKGMLIVYVILVLFLGYTALSSLSKRSEAKDKAEIALRELDRTKAQKEELGAALASLSTTEGMEDALRQKYQVVKDGEELIVVTEDANKNTQTGEDEEHKSFWQKIKDFFNKEN